VTPIGSTGRQYDGMFNMSERQLSSVTKKTPKLTFKTLKRRGQDIIMRLTNSIALQDRDCCTVDDFAEEFKTTPGRLKTTLKRLEEAGLIELSGEETQLVIPTTKLLRHQDRHLTEDQAAKLIRQYKKVRYE
jgi:DNA-binding MarR family transcriptional regulator